MQNEKIFDAWAWWFYKQGVRPDHFTFLQAPVYALMTYVGYHADGNARLLLSFMGLQLVVFLLDGADGILARRTGTVTRRGHLLDALFDVIGIGLTLWVAFHLHPELSQWILLLLLVNFLVYIQNEIQGTKSVTYTRGPVTIGLFAELYFPGLLLIGILLPLAIGIILMLTRVAWRKRLWNYYQFVTAGLRREYKAVPRSERAGLAPRGTQFPSRRTTSPPKTGSTKSQRETDEEESRGTSLPPPL